MATRQDFYTAARMARHRGTIYGLPWIARKIEPLMAENLA